MDIRGIDMKSFPLISIWKQILTSEPGSGQERLLSRILCHDGANVREASGGQGTAPRGFALYHGQTREWGTL